MRHFYKYKNVKILLETLEPNVIPGKKISMGAAPPVYDPWKLPSGTNNLPR